MHTIFIQMPHQLPNVKMALIALDNQATISTLSNILTQLSQYLLDKIHTLLMSLCCSCPQICAHVEWVPRDSEVPRNELADQYAKKVAKGTCSAHVNLLPFLHQWLPVSITTLKAN